MSAHDLSKLDEQLQSVLATHFDPKWGAPYWLDLRPTFPFDPLRDVRRMDDLHHFGPMNLEALATRPIEDFIPKRYHASLPQMITSETGGTTGPPKRTAFLPEEFHEAFVAPFLEAAARVGFPRDGSWLFIGPSGPHIIGKAARACAAALGSIDPFAVDFDPRWVRKLPADSMARRRYVEHVLDQAESVLRTQRIAVIFSTPPVLSALGQRLEAAIRNDIAGIHLGGMAAETDFWRSLTSEWFPNAVALSGYGNSLVGMCPQLEPANALGVPEYFPYGNRLVYQSLSGRVGEREALQFHRLDKSAFLPNVVERDEATLVSRAELAEGTRFQPVAIQDPRPPRETGGLWLAGCTDGRAALY